MLADKALGCPQFTHSKPWVGTAREHFNCVLKTRVSHRLLDHPKRYCQESIRTTSAPHALTSRLPLRSVLSWGFPGPCIQVAHRTIREKRQKHRPRQYFINTKARFFAVLHLWSQAVCYKCYCLGSSRKWSWFVWMQTWSQLFILPFLLWYVHCWYCMYWGNCHLKCL